ncbi:cytoplasmic dynein 1 intermediate chain isoform X14 [Cardiocondyla obscurior]|uniref:cytoplasmic dynein 1 intermediate chain isoform X14 n=1 Tax=Cardiocondyla obscurior TaxID=286306 RepID=UPI00396565D9
MMSDRKAELERKKAKLQAIREEKERRRREKEQKDVEEATVRASGADKDQRKEIDAMLSSLGVAPVSDVLSSLTSASSLTPEQSANATPDASLQPSSINSAQSSGRRKNRELTIVSVAHTNIPPKEPVVYSKQTQTIQTTHTSHDGLSTSSSAYTIYSSCSTTTPTHSCSAGYFETDWWRPRKAEDEENSLPHMDGFQSKLPPGILPHGLPQVKEVQPAVTQVEQEKQKEKPRKEVRELSEEEKQMIILSEDFQRFLDRTSRIVERALGESVDIYTDYAGTMDGEDGMDEKSHQRLWLNRSFICERWSRNRCVTSMDWSPQFPELLAASYNNNDDTPNDPDGVCLIWNTKFKKTTPEFIFHCQSPVMSTTFARFHPNLILGGTYSGQIVLWDNRVQKRTPIQRTPLSATAHTHPVYCLSVVGTQNAHNLISISTDGKLCSWSLDMLSQPQEALELHTKQSKAIAATCLAFPHGDVNNFVMGSEDGTVYSACRHGSRAGLTETYEGHQGPVTGISAHAVQGGIDFSHLFLTSSIDWTIKLWSLKENKPLYSFEHNGDYIYDVAWSPTHPALFAAVDDSGRLDLWNLNQDTEVPAASVVVDGCPALNRVSWTPSGLHVTVGDDTGKIWVYDVAEHLAHPRIDEWNKFLYTQQDLKNNKADEELDKLNLSSGPSSLTSMTSISSVPLR